MSVNTNHCAGFLKNIGPLKDLSTGVEISADEFRREVRLRASALRDLDLGPGRRAVIAHGNSIPFLRDLFAVWHLDAAAVPVHPALTGFELDELLRLCEASLHLAPFVDRKTNYCFTSHRPEALILFSSGSTGSPKGIVHSWSALSYRLRQIQQQLGGAPRTLCFLPLSFGHGLIGNCLAPWLSGAPLRLMPDLNPVAAYRLGTVTAAERIEFFSSVPSVWKMLNRVSAPPAWPGLRRVHCASAPLDAGAREFMRVWCAGADVFNVYGMSEAASWVAGARILDSTADGLVGEMWGAEAVLVAGGELVTRPGVEAEVCLRSEGFMSGYLSGEPAPAYGAFHRTGDLGMWDEKGRLVLRGRLGAEINKGGMKISPQEIRLCLERHPEVLEAHVCAVADEIWGEAVGVALVPRDPAHFSLEEIKTWSRMRLAPVKQASHWRVVNEVPRGVNGKVQNKTLSALFAAQEIT